MSGEPVFIVERRRKLGWRTRLYFPALIRSLWIALRRMRASHRKSRGPDDRPIDDREQRLANYPDGFRGMPVLVSDSSGALRCDACGRCAAVCPSRCIDIEAVASKSGAPPERFDLDMGRCIFCGLCEEACPTAAIVMSPHAELDAYDREGLIFHKSDLTVPVELLPNRVRDRGGSER